MLSIINGNDFQASAPQSPNCNCHFLVCPPKSLNCHCHCLASPLQSPNCNCLCIVCPPKSLNCHCHYLAIPTQWPNCLPPHTCGWLPCHSAVQRTTLHFTTLQCKYYFNTTLHYTALHCTLSQYSAQTSAVHCAVYSHQPAAQWRLFRLPPTIHRFILKIDVNYNTDYEL